MYRYKSISKKDWTVLFKIMTTTYLRKRKNNNKSIEKDVAISKRSAFVLIYLKRKKKVNLLVL